MPAMLAVSSEAESGARRIEGWSVYDKVPNRTEIKQGDLVAFENTDNLKKFALIVTADCDLSRRKHGRLLTLVPVLEVRDVVEQYLLIEQCDRQRTALTALASKSFGIAGDLNDPENAEALRLKVEEHARDPAWSLQCIAANAVLHNLDRITAKDFTNIMKLASVQPGDVASKLDQQLQSKGDVLMLPSISSLGIAADIAWVRHVWQVPLRHIVHRTSELKEGYGQIVARLDSPYRYRLTQMMAQVFADIGLPDSKRNVKNDLDQLFL